MQNIMRKTAATAVMGGALLFTGGVGMANAAPPVQEGLVNLNIGDVTVLQDVDVAVVAQVVAQLCDTNVTAAVLGEINQTGGKRTFCTIDGLGPIEVTQSGPGGSENAPGQQNR